MQHSDDRPPASGRPSLLSAEQQGEADRQRILSGLETKPSLTTAGAQKARSGAVKWVAAGAAVLALTAGAGAWLVSEGEKEIVLAGTAPLPATPAPAAPLASEPVPAGAQIGEEVSTAAILQDTPVMAEKAPAPAPGAAPSVPAPSAPKGKPTDELKSLLEKGLPAPAKRSAPPPLVLADAAPYAGAPVKAAPVAVPKAKAVKSAPAKPAPVKAAPKPAAVPDENAQASNVQPKPVKKTVVAKADPKAKAKSAPAKKKEAPSKASAKEDTDVALLAALVAHSKATQPKSASSAAAKLRQCKTLGSVADAEQCRTKLCAGSAKNEAECKPARVAKAVAES